jgi:hypothetical protein
MQQALPKNQKKNLQQASDDHHRWPCSAGWLPASQQCFSLTPVQHQPPVTSQPAVFFSHNKSASATSQPNEADISVT